MNTHAPDRNDGGARGLPVIRPEAADGGDAGEIRSLTAAAFDGIEQSDGREPAIIDALREAGALTLSLVAVRSGWAIGHIAASPVTLTGGDGEAAGRWFGLGPLSVSPPHQGEGIGAALMRAALELLASEHGAVGAVLLGEPAYYDRFGFRAREGLVMEGLPEDSARYFQALRLDGGAAYPQAVVSYHPAFGA
jgi:putative acetyltransferase